MASSDTRTLTEQTAPAPTSATNPTSPSPPPDATVVMDCSDARPLARTRPEQTTPPRVLIISVEGGNKLNPFQAAKALSEFGTVSDVLRLSETKYEVIMSSEEETSHLLAAKELTFVGKEKSSVSVPVSVSLHPTKNFALGVITCRELDGAT